MKYKVYVDNKLIAEFKYFENRRTFLHTVKQIYPNIKFESRGN